MKKFIIPLVIVALCLALIPVAAMNTFAEGGSDEVSIPDNTLIDYGYLKTFKEQLRQELIEELTASGGITVNTTYEDVSLKEGQFIILSPDSEVIYRGGGAVVISSSNAENEGITDMSKGTELFSGESLEYGHIYYASATESKKAVLVTGSKAYFTVRGSYEIV